MCALVDTLDGRTLCSANELRAAGIAVVVDAGDEDYCLCSAGLWEMRRALSATGRIFRETDWGWSEEEPVQ